MPSTKAKREKSPEMPDLEPIEPISKPKPAPPAATAHITDLTKPSTKTAKRLNALRHNQRKFMDAEANYFDELHSLQAKYALIYGGIFERRRQIVIGECEPSAEESSWPANDESPLPPSEEKKPQDAADDDDEEKGVANFWLEVLQSSKTVASMIFDQDEAALSYLQDVRVKIEPDKGASSYTLEFEFAENPFFRNRVLTKSFEYENRVKVDELKYRGPRLVCARGCEIDWKPKKNLTVKLIKKKLKSRNRKAPPKIITKEKKQNSFFGFFETRFPPDKEEEEEEKKKEAAAVDKEDQKDDDSNKQVAILDKKAAGAAAGTSSNESETDSDIDRMLTDTFRLMHEMTVAERLRKCLIPRAVLFMTGEIPESECSEEDEDDYDDDYDDDEDYYYGGEDDFDTNEDDDDDDAGPYHRNGRARGQRRWNSRPSGRSTRPPDCNQN